MVCKDSVEELSYSLTILQKEQYCPQRAHEIELLDQLYKDLKEKRRTQRSPLDRTKAYVSRFELLNMMVRSESHLTFIQAHFLTF